jgi:hypothetical protein
LDPIRVLVTNMPAMLRGIVSASLAAQPNLLLLPDPGTSEPLHTTVRASDADVLVVGVTDLDALHGYDALLYKVPDACIVGVTLDGRQASIAQLTPHHEVVGQVSTDGVAAALREAVYAARARRGAAMPNAGSRPQQ